MRIFKTTILLVFLLLTVVQHGFSKKQKLEFYSLIVYRIKDKVQEEKVDQYLKQAYLPALHRMGKNKVGVFKPIASDTVSYGKVIYVLTAFQSLDEFSKITAALIADQKLQVDGATYLNSKYNEAPYERMETILMRAFANMPMMEAPQLTGPRSERIYELRSYEGPTEKLYQSKVKMFNTGDEIGLFKRLQFNAVFYAEVLAGGRMPNLIYMTTFENRASRDEHWKAFSEDPQWKKLVAIDEYKNTVSKNDTRLLAPTDYSDY
ncbi:MAG TPA: NIPSNAP family protein [Chryseolinea sp.]|nr:NIPSNAP family protein [Chryseolinea sp.]HPM29560.1 NIPSNAP family protein [Chryseolinea sp.]